MSVTRNRFCLVCSSFRSAAFFLNLNFVMPAASSMMCRLSCGRDDTIWPIRPCSMIEYALVPTPVPRKKSVMSRSRQGVLLRKYCEVPSRNSRRVIVTSLYCAKSMAGGASARSSCASRVAA
jgi:hypothetical protein